MSKSETSQNFSSPEFLAALRERQTFHCDQLVRAYTEQLYRAALGLGFDKTVAQDIVQSCWTTFFDVVPGFEGKSHVRTFIFGILYNKASEQRRENRKIDPSDAIEELLDSRFDERGNWIKPPTNAESFMIAFETMELIQNCIDALPLNQRMAFTLKEIEENETKEICNILEVSATNLGVLLYRAKNRLRECVEGKAKRAGKV